MDKFAKFIESDAFFPVLVVLLIVLIAAFLWVLIFNKNKTKGSKKKGDFVPASDDEIKFISNIPSSTPSNLEEQKQDDFLFTDVGTKLNTNISNEESATNVFNDHPIEDNIKTDNVETISNIVNETISNTDKNEENLVDENVISNVSIFDKKIEPIDDISINDNFININIDDNDIVVEENNGDDIAIIENSNELSVDNNMEDIFEYENININDDLIDDMIITSDEDSEEVALIKETSNDNYEDDNNIDTDDDIPSAELIIEPTTEEYELPKSKDVTAFEYEPTEDESINEDIDIEMPQEYIGEKTEIFDFPDFDNIDDIVNNDSEDLEREIIEAANNYIKAVMER